MEWNKKTEIFHLQINLIQDDDGIAELNPDEFFNNILRTLRDAIDGDFIIQTRFKTNVTFLVVFFSFSSCSAANIDAENVLCLGLSVQRSTFITFDKITGRPFHQLITWQDRRGDEIVRRFNGSLLLKAVNAGATILHFFTRSDRFKQASRLRIENDFVMLSFCNFCTSET